MYINYIERQAASNAQTIREQKRQIERLEGDLQLERQRLKDAKQLTRKHQHLADRQSGRIRELEVINEHRKGEMLKVWRNLRNANHPSML